MIVMTKQIKEKKNNNSVLFLSSFIYLFIFITVKLSKSAVIVYVHHFRIKRPLQFFYFPLYASHAGNFFFWISICLCVWICEHNKKWAAGSCERLKFLWKQHITFTTEKKKYRSYEKRLTVLRQLKHHGCVLLFITKLSRIMYLFTWSILVDTCSHKDIMRIFKWQPGTFPTRLFLEGKKPLIKESP